MWQEIKKKNHHFLIKQIAIQAIYVSLYLIFTFVPWIGFITIPTLPAITTISVVVTLHIYHTGFIGAITSGLAFGLSSLVASYTIGDVTGLFYHPDISVLDRVLMALCVYLFFKFTPKKMYIYVIGAVLTSLLNTVFVTSSIFLHKQVLIWMCNDGKCTDMGVFSNEMLNNIGIWIIAIWIGAVGEMAFSLVMALPLYALARYARNNLIESKKNSWE